MDFEFNYRQNILLLYYELNTRTYKISPSICFIVTKPKIREVFAALFRDRIVHHLVINKLEPLFEKYFINSSYGCRKNKGTLYGLYDLFKKIYEESNHYTLDCYVAKFDCKSYFTSIDKNILYKELKEFIIKYYNNLDRKTLLWLVKLIIFNDPTKNCINKSGSELWKKLPKDKSLFHSNGKGLPIGNLTSLWFANFYLTKFDKWASSIYPYGRYIDDFYVITKNKRSYKNFYRISTKKLDKRCTISESKIYCQHYSKGITFIGAHLKINRAYISNKTLGRILNKFIYACNNGKTSYIGLLKHYSNHKILCSLLNLIHILPMKEKCFKEFLMDLRK